MSSKSKGGYPVISLFIALALMGVGEVNKLPAVVWGVFILWWVGFGIWYHYHKYD